MRNIDLEAERKYENSKVLDSNVRAKQSKFYWATKLPTEKHNQKTLEKIVGAKVLEIGCSNGSDAKRYSKVCASYTGVDISDEAIQAASRLGLANTEFICTDGHHLPFDDKQFDFVIVNSLLHHLDLEVSFSEINRVLKENGELIFREPLGTNPIFYLYRLMTPSARTIDERPFTFSDLRIMNKYFFMQEVNWFGFSSIASAFVKFDFVRLVLTRIDDILSKTPIRYLYWQFCGFAKKK